MSYTATYTDFKKHEHMVYPPIQELLEDVDCRYSLVIMASKRARQLVEGQEVMVDDCPSDKHVTQAIYEMYEDKVRCESELPNAEK